MLCVLLLGAVLGRAQARYYSNAEQIDITVNAVRPFGNPAETYAFYSLPFCQPATSKDEEIAFGDALAGDRRKQSAYEIFFRSTLKIQNFFSPPQIYYFENLSLYYY